MRKNLAYKFILPIALALSIVAVVLFFLISYEINKIENERVKRLNVDFIQNQARHELGSEDFLVFDSADAQENFVEYVAGIKNSEIVRVKIWNTDSRIIYSDVASDMGGVFSDNDELAEALQGEIVAETEEADELNIKYAGSESFAYEKLMELYVPILLEDSGQIIGVAETYVNLDNVAEKILEFQIFFLISIVTALILMLVLTLVFFRKYIVDPLENFARISSKISAGDLSQRVALESQDEFGNLAQIFNQMLDSVEASNGELVDIENKLRDERSNLEKKVKERTRQLEEIKVGLDEIVKRQTAELREKLEENKMVNDMMIGREARMAELKNELEKLREQLVSKK